MLDITESAAHTDYNVVDSILEKLDRIQERAEVLETKDTTYAVDILAKLDHDLHEVLRRLKRGK
jgi:hypothetical protein